MMRGLRLGMRGDMPAAAGEFIRSLRERPFQLALLLSLLAHAALLWLLAGGGDRPAPAPVRMMRVRIIAPPPAATGSPGLPPSLPTPASPGSAPLRSPASSPPKRDAGGGAIAPTPPGTLLAQEAMNPWPPAIEAGELPGVVLAAETAPDPSAVAENASSILADPEIRPEDPGVAGPPNALSPSPGGGLSPAGSEDEASASFADALRPPTDGPEPGRAAISLEHLAALRSRIEARKMYPQLAVRNGWQGEVVVELALGGGGRLQEMRLVRGSGYAVLDEATFVAIRRAAPFPPLEGVVTVPVDYRLTP